MKVYVLFQTDAWRTKSSRVLFGVFSTRENAELAAIDNDLGYLQSDGYDIVECELDKFEV